MALWRATVYKRSTIFGERWSNVYTVSAIDAFNALEAGTNLMAAERSISYSTVLFEKVHVVDLGDTERTRTNMANDLPGLLSPTGLGGPLPLFCTTRVVFTNLEGKPEQKYLRLGANEANLTLGLWDGEFVSFVQDNYADPLVANTQFVGPGGEAHLDATVVAAVQNRQLGWHRRGRPGFKRGWVPV
jgi:hypothetical protein